MSRRLEGISQRRFSTIYLPAHLPNPPTPSTQAHLGSLGTWAGSDGGEGRTVVL